ncbi:MAG: hypothetical protein EOP49_04810 [Sphingobacteriales bacterium]|nr:MAG: hypothetical protein EOP49_04810 [Sphingobacteriales bacterium]
MKLRRLHIANLFLMLVIACSMMSYGAGDLRYHPHEFAGKVLHIASNLGIISDPDLQHIFQEVPETGKAKIKIKTRYKGSDYISVTPAETVVIATMHFAEEQRFPVRSRCVLHRFLSSASLRGPPVGVIS